VSERKKLKNVKYKDYANYEKLENLTNIKQGWQIIQRHNYCCLFRRCCFTLLHLRGRHPHTTHW